MPEIPSPPKDFFSDDQCWVWRSGSNSLAKLSKLIRLSCLDPGQQIKKAGYHAYYCRRECTAYYKQHYLERLLCSHT